MTIGVMVDKIIEVDQWVGVAKEVVEVVQEVVGVQ
jgi:hypothetical protein